jgi:hypothetical protein
MQILLHENVIYISLIPSLSGTVVIKSNTKTLKYFACLSTQSESPLIQDCGARSNSRRGKN